MLISLLYGVCILTATSSKLRAPKLCAINFELGGATHSVGAFLTATTADPIISRQFLRIGTVILLIADEAFTRLLEDRCLASRTIGSASIQGQISRIKILMQQEQAYHGA